MKVELNFDSSQARELLEKAQVYEMLSFKQIIVFLWWSTFNLNKMKTFLNSLNDGKSPIYAYKDTIEFKNK